MSAIIKKGQSAVSSKDRAKFVSSRLQELSKSMAEQYIETGLLLKEYKENGYFKEDGYESFNEAIDAMQNQGKLEFGSRAARNLIDVVNMAAAQGMKPEQLEGIPISSLREIASLPAAEQKKMLPEAKNMSVAEVQEQAKKIRHKARGHDVDPYDPIIMKDATASMKTAFNAHIAEARRIYGIPDEVSDTVVLIDHILAEWAAGAPQSEAEAIEAEITKRTSLATASM